MKVLLTGFEPFGGEKLNPSYEAIKLVEDSIDGMEIIKVQIPTVYKKSIDVLDKTIEELKPDIVICVGQAGGRFDMTVERVAINIDDARISDNEGNQPVDEMIFKDGQNAYFSGLPVKSIVMEMRNAGIPASVSNTAGTFVCNHLMYGLLYLVDKKYPLIKGGFIHVPFIPEQILNKPQMPYMELGRIAEAIAIAVKASAADKITCGRGMGQIC